MQREISLTIPSKTNTSKIHQLENSLNSKHEDLKGDHWWDAIESSIESIGGIIPDIPENEACSHAVLFWLDDTLLELWFGGGQWEDWSLSKADDEHIDAAVVFFEGYERTDHIEGFKIWLGQCHVADKQLAEAVAIEIANRNHIQEDIARYIAREYLKENKREIERALEKEISI